MSWTVVLTGRARRDLTRVDRPTAARILDALTRFASTSHGDVRRVRGTADEWRLRVGEWRVRFRYVLGTLQVLRILPRGEAYR